MNIKKLLASVLLGFIAVTVGVVLLYMLLTYFPAAAVVLVAILAVALVSATIYTDLNKEKPEEENTLEE